MRTTGALDTLVDFRDRARGILRTARHLPHSAYYALSARNYRYRALATRKRVRDSSFRSYELYNRHGDDRLLSTLLDRYRDGDVIVDVGANTGVYALSIAAEYPGSTVIAIEPDPRTVGKLRANIAASDLGDRIHVFPIGLGDETATVTFYRSSYHELSSFNQYNAERWGARIVDTKPIRIATLDSLVAGGEIPPPDHLKIDTEGFGYETLQGSLETLATHRPLVYVEPHATADGEDNRTGPVATRIRHLLDAHDYTVIADEDAWIGLPEEES